MVAFLPLALPMSNRHATRDARGAALDRYGAEITFLFLGTPGRPVAQQVNARMSVTGSAGVRSGFW